MTYRDRIRTECARQGFLGADPRHIEAWMRDAHGTLDGLSASQFAAEVANARELAMTNPTLSEDIAASYGIAK